MPAHGVRRSLDMGRFAQIIALAPASAAAEVTESLTRPYDSRGWGVTSRLDLFVDAS
ncbi:hypothetical protein [Streptomyces zaehneri]|uniref:hypothetical protein n=1 Tax=Streptomyces zaehneri TaxID=3051180 RepID=UPI0028D4FC3D|nr:hypothetical protein [Streptomyces sp. DSM 40713]